jgi:hypothetical protein
MHVPVNMLLRTEDVRLTPATAKAIFAALRNAKPDIVAKAKRELIAPADIVRNARLTDDQTLRMIYDRYGEAGLFDLFVLTGSELHRADVLRTDRGTTPGGGGHQRPRAEEDRSDDRRAARPRRW